MVVCMRQFVKEVERVKGRRGVNLKDIQHYLESALAKAVKKGILNKRGEKFNLAKSCKTVSLKKSQSISKRASRKETSRRDSCVLKKGKERKSISVDNKKISKKSKKETNQKRTVKFQLDEEPKMNIEPVSRTRRYRGRYNLRRNLKIAKSFVKFGVRSTKVKHVKRSFCHIPSSAKVRNKRSNKDQGVAVTSKKGRTRSPSRENRATDAFRVQVQTSSNEDKRTTASKRERSSSRASKRNGSDSDDNLSESQSKLLSIRDSLEVLKERISRKSLDQEPAAVPTAPCPEPRTEQRPSVPEECPEIVMFDPQRQSCSSKSLFSVFSWPQKQ